jgi:hypothetical protein
MAFPPVLMAQETCPPPEPSPAPDLPPHPQEPQETCTDSIQLWSYILYLKKKLYHEQVRSEYLYDKIMKTHFIPFRADRTYYWGANNTKLQIIENDISISNRRLTPASLEQLEEHYEEYGSIEFGHDLVVKMSDILQAAEESTADP